MLQLRCGYATGKEAMVRLLLQETESPIEENLLSPLAGHFVAEAGSRFCAIIRSPFDWKNPDNIKLMSEPPVSPPPFDGLQIKGVGIAAQVVVDNYRADFALQKLYVKRGEFSVGRTLLIECDGYNFHNKYEWQIARDEERDQRIMQQFDCSILRLRGYEIHQNAYGCAARALDLLDEMACYESENQRFIGLGQHDEEAESD